MLFPAFSQSSPSVSSGRIAIDNFKLRKTRLLMATTACKEG